MLKFWAGDADRSMPNGAHRVQVAAFTHLVEKADAQRDANNPAAAAAVYGAALEINQANTDIRVQYANMLKDSGAPTDAIVQYHRALAEKPHDWDILLQLGRAYVQLGQYGEAEESFRMALALCPTATDVSDHIANLRLQQETDAALNTDAREMRSLIASSELFDAEFYAQANPLMLPGESAIDHYIRAGWHHYNQTSRDFDGAVYYAHERDVRNGSLPALVHALRSKSAERGRLPDRGRVVWSNDVARPDDIVNFDRLRAASFFFRYDLGSTFAGKNITLINSAARSISRARPRFEGAPVSIIIPVYGQTLWCLNCLESLADHRSRYSFEVIVYDDASPAEHYTHPLSTIPWIRYIRGESNLGFIGACNAAAEIAPGEYLVFLNSDTRVCQGWLDELIGTFEQQPKAGLVGSKLFYEDGTLQEAGCIVWRDGSAWNYGRNDDPNRSQYCFARQTDYCSGAAIAVRRGAWNQLEGFDTHFSPAYYEDVDLAFRMRSIGLQVWYQPLARVLHYEGKTHGTDLQTGVKAYQAINAAKFAERWSTTLKDYRPNGHEPLLEANRTHPMRVLALDAETPTPDRDAGSVMTFKLLQLLQRLGWHVTFLPVHDTRYNAHYGEALARLGIEVVSQPTDPIVHSFIEARSNAYVMVLGFRVTVLADLMPFLRKVLPQARVLFHDIDLHYVRMEREAAVTGSAMTRLDAAAMKVRELDLCASVDCNIVPSTEEKVFIQNEIGAEHTVVYSYTSEVVSSPSLSASRRHIVFVGGFRHPPNIDAVRFFVSEIWPIISRQLGDDVKFYIVGPNVPEDLAALGDDRVIFTGYIEDLSSILEKCRVFVAPLRYGAGLKGKVVTALSNGIPCVATSIAIEGMGLCNGQNVLIADEAVLIGDRILQLYNDDRLWLNVREEGLHFVDEAYSWEAGEKVVKEAVATAERVWMARKIAPARAKVNLLRAELQLQATSLDDLKCEAK